MPQVTRYASGTPCWPGLRSPSTHVSCEFYRRLFGWQPGPPAPNGYVIFCLDGRAVAGVGPLLKDGQRPGWCMYVATHDVDATVETAVDRRAEVLVAPLEVDGGRVAAILDPTGAEVWLWQPAGFDGAQVTNEPGSMCWNELGAADLENAKAFYGAVFGWSTATISYKGADSLAWIHDGKAIGGLVHVGEEHFVDDSAQWLVSFAVEDLDSTASKSIRLGGRAAAIGAGILPGRSTVIQDATGTPLSIRQCPKSRDFASRSAIRE